MKNCYEVTYSIDGVIRKINVPAENQMEVMSIVTNMFLGTRVEIINAVLR